MKVILLSLLILTVGVTVIGFTEIQAQSDEIIPSWVKAVAGYWAEGNIDDLEFIEALEFLIESGVLVLPNYQEITIPISESIISNDTETDNNLQEQTEAIMVESGIQVNTDKTSYTSGENIIISGSVGILEEYSQSVTIVVVDPNGNVADLSQVMPESDGSFSHVTSSNVITIPGEYEVRAQYGSLKTTSNFNFE